MPALPKDPYSPHPLLSVVLPKIEKEDLLNVAACPLCYTKTGKDNPVTRCHAVTHNDPTENLYGALIIGGVVTGLTLGPEVPALLRELYYWQIITFFGNPELFKDTVQFVEGASNPGPPNPTIFWEMTGNAAKIGASELGNFMQGHRTRSVGDLGDFAKGH